MVRHSPVWGRSYFHSLSLWYVSHVLQRDFFLTFVCTVWVLLWLFQSVNSCFKTCPFSTQVIMQFSISFQWFSELVMGKCLCGNAGLQTTDIKPRNTRRSVTCENEFKQTNWRVQMSVRLNVLGVDHSFKLKPSLSGATVSADYVKWSVYCAVSVNLINECGLQNCLSWGVCAPLLACSKYNTSLHGQW